MTVAAVDCGTNSVRLLVSADDGRELARVMRITRLGKGVDATGRLDPGAIARTLEVLAGYADICRSHGVERIRAAATSAARDASNSADFFGPATSTLGVEPELLSGDAEARLSFAGATADRDPREGPFLVCDIGGGSTEFVFGTEAPERLISVDIGCVRLTERCLPSDPPTRSELEAAAAEVDGLLEAVPGAVPVADARVFLGLAGTVTSIAAYVAGLHEHDPAVTHGLVIPVEKVRAVLDELASVPLSLRRGRLVEAERADVIVGGCIVLDRAMERFGFDTVVVSEHDILDGLAATARRGGGAAVTW